MAMSASQSRSTAPLARRSLRLALSAHLGQALVQLTQCRTVATASVRAVQGLCRGPAAAALISGRAAPEATQGLRVSAPMLRLRVAPRSEAPAGSRQAPACRRMGGAPSPCRCVQLLALSGSLAMRPWARCRDPRLGAALPVSHLAQARASVPPAPLPRRHSALVTDARHRCPAGQRFRRRLGWPHSAQKRLLTPGPPCQPRTAGLRQCRSCPRQAWCALAVRRQRRAWRPRPGRGQQQSSGIGRSQGGPALHTSLERRRRGSTLLQRWARGTLTSCAGKRRHWRAEGLQLPGLPPKRGGTL